VIVYEQAAECAGHIRPASDVYPLERANRIEQPRVMHVEAGLTKNASELEDVHRQIHCPAPLASARLRIAWTRSPRTAWISS
jgi:hypothetical protein